MVKRHMMNMGIVAVAVSGLVNFTATSSFAASQPLVAAVVFEDLLIIQSPLPINFATIQRPSVGRGSNTVTVTPGGVRSISGSGDGALNGGIVNNGSVTVFGTATTIVNLSGAPGTCSDPALDITSFTFSNATPTTNDGTGCGAGGSGGCATEAHGGALFFDFNVTTGAHTCNYFINANY